MHLKTTEVVFFFLKRDYSGWLYSVIHCFTGCEEAYQLANHNCWLSFSFSETFLIYNCRQDGLPSIKKAYTKLVMIPPSITLMKDSKEKRRV